MGSNIDNVLQDNGASYLRVASIAIAVYDFILTLPAEWRFYKSQRSWRLSPGFMLFILIRYVSIATIVVSNIGYFGSFSTATCRGYYLAAPVLKVLQTMVSQVILGIRTVNIARRSQWIMWSLAILFTITTVMEWFTNIFHRSPAQNDAGNCTPGNSPNHLSAWLYYVVAMTYDVVTLVISSYFLLGLSHGKLSGLIKLLFYDGLGYFVALTGANVFNLILYRTSDISYQSSGASVGYVVTWIMSQRILIHLRDAAADHHQPQAQIFSRQLQTPRDISHAMRSQFEPKPTDRFDEEFALGSTTKPECITSLGPMPSSELDVRVQVEQSVTVDFDPRAYERESYRAARSGLATAAHNGIAFAC